ncbi:MAG: AraC family transcriptional regulator [Kribbellaceae bacterium]|nr:AraC family transcriptional regulator [Kribbellaceae bacterium]
MDVVSDVLTTLRTGRPHAARTRTSVPWGVRFPALGGSGCHVVLQGSCWFLSDELDPIQLAAGDLVFVPHPRVYTLADDPTTTPVEFNPVVSERRALGKVEIPGDGAVTETVCAAYYFDRSRIHPFLEDLPPVLHLPATPGRRSALHGVVELLGGELSADRHGGDLAVPALIDTLLIYVLREWLDDHPATGWAASLNDPAMLSALRGIHLQPERQWTVEDLAREAGLSRATFAARFKATASMAPLGYLTWWRMTLAARLLRTTDDPLRVIAGKVGYTSEFAFTKAFKRVYGVPPRHYRTASAA